MLGNKLDLAIETARKYHIGQTYEGKSYVDGHLLPCLVFAKQHTNDENILCSVVLHDILEDTAYTKKQIIDDFGKEIYDIVWRVTDEGGGTREQKKERTYKKLKGHPKSIFVKLIDRYINTKTGKKNDMYRKEQNKFRSSIEIKGQHQELWNKIEDNLRKKL